MIGFFLVSSRSDNSTEQLTYMGCSNSSSPKEGKDYTATTKVEAGSRPKRGSKVASPVPVPAAGANNNNNNNSGTVTTYYDRDDLDSFNDHIKKEAARKAAEEAQRKRDEEAAAQKRREEDEAKRKQQEAEWDAFDKEEHAHNQQLRADLKDGTIQENVLTL